jgi:ATP-dependent DNA ligase
VEFGLEPQLAKSAPTLPLGEEWSYEQKFDGFRAIVFVDGDSHRIQSRGTKDLTRYFPELAFPSGRYVVDGEIVIDGEGDAQAFGALQQRIHPAASRIERLSTEWPASYVAFDLLELDGVELLGEPFEARRAALERMQGLPPSAGSTTRRASSRSASTPPTPPGSGRRWSRSNGCARSTAS